MKASRFSLFLALLMLATFCVGTSVATAEEPVTITFWKAAINEDRNVWWEETLAAFETEYPNIKVEFLGVAGDTAAFNQKLDMAVAAGEAPDIISSYLDPAYITRGIIEPLGEYYDSWDGKEEIPEKYLDIFYKMDLHGDPARLYCMPFGGNVQCLYVRPDLLAAAGLDIPATWDAFFAAAEATTDLDAGVYGYIIRGGSGGPSALEQLMYSYSGINDFFIDGKTTINDPLHVEFVERYLGGYGTYTSQDDINKGWPEMAAQFQSGNAVMMVHNLGSASANYDAFGNDEDVVRAVPYPASQTGHITIPAAQPAGNMMTASSENKEAAWTLLSYLSRSDIASAYEQMMSNMPVNTVSMQDEWIQGTSYMKMGADVQNDPETVMCNFPYYLPNFNVIENDYASPGLQQVLLGELTAQAFLDGWAELLQEDYDTLMAQ